MKNDEVIELLVNEIQPLLTENQLTCDVPNGQIGNRSQQLQEIRSLVISDSFDVGTVFLQFTYDQKTAHLLLDFVTQEQTCCPFFDFKLGFYKEKLKIILEISSDKLEDQELRKITTMFKN